jgi:pimeloyl-ACP methyl ester carboxylesterase
MPRMKSFMFIIGLLLITTAPSLAQDGSNYEPTNCPFTPTTAVSPECGYVTVPEVHAEPDGDTIRLAVAVYTSTANDPAPDPIVLAQGGPGGSTLQLFGSDLGFIVDFLAQSRDVVLIEQRGTLYSEPSLICDEVFEQSIDLLSVDISFEESFALQLEANAACRDRLESEGVNLDAFDSLENAADVPLVMDALGYTGQFNYYGISYGTMLAQHLMRDHGDRVRAAILDAIVPLDNTFLAQVPQTFQGSMDALFAECAADAVCNITYPDLEADFYALVDQLNAEPTTVTISDPEQPGQTYELFLNGDNLVSLTFSSMYSIGLQMPRNIGNMIQGDFSWIEQIGGFILLDRSVADGMFNSVICAEDGLDYTADDVLLDGVNERLVAVMAPSSLNFPTVCEAWNVEQLGDFADEPITTDIPVLVTSGQFDPITPPSYADPTIINMSNAYSYTFPRVGHGAVVGGGDCALNIMNDFLANPSEVPDTSCIDTPDFVLPAVGEVTLVPFTNEDFGVSGLIPEGWEDFGFGTYAESVTSTTALLIQAAPASIDDILGALASQLGIESFGDVTGEREANGFTWVFYSATAQGQTIVPAFAQQGGITYLVVLITSPGDVDFFTEAILNPVVDSIVPIE